VGGETRTPVIAVMKYFTDSMALVGTIRVVALVD